MSVSYDSTHVSRDSFASSTAVAAASLSEISRDLTNVGAALHERGDLKTAMKLYQQAMRTTIVCLGREDGNFWSCENKLRKSSKLLEEGSQRLATLSGRAIERNSQRVMEEASMAKCITDPLRITVSAIASQEVDSSITLYNTGLAHLELGATTVASELFEMSLQVLPPVGTGSPSFPLVLSAALNNLGYCMVQRSGCIIDASPYFSDAREAIHDCGHVSDASRRFSAVITFNLVKTMSSVGDELLDKNMYSEAIKVYVDVMKMRSPMSIVFAEVMHKIGVIHIHYGDFQRARKACDFALELLHDGDNKTPIKEQADIFIQVGISQRAIGNFCGALYSFGRALCIRRWVFGWDHWVAAEPLQLIGSIHELRNNLNGALDAYKEAVQAQQLSLGRQHPAVAVTLSRVGHILRINGKFDEAKAVYEEILCILRLFPRAHHAAISHTLRTIGQICLELGNYEEAEEHLRGALEEFSQGPGNFVKSCLECCADAGAAAA